MFFLFFILSAIQINQEFSYIGKSEQFTLKSGKYRVHCYGAQGGYSYKNGQPFTYGGYGAYARGEMKLVGNERTFYAFVGGQGGQGNNGINNGGFNGGGNSGYNTNYDANYVAGGGGGSTDIRIDTDEIDNRIIVAGGGSGATEKWIGAVGGDTTGRCTSPSNGVASSNMAPSQSYGNALLQGGDGVSGNALPGSGGGGGFYGGKGGSHNTAMNSVGYSGSSTV